jgi:dihydroorotase-like cyclic amidohydrolase
MMCERPAKILGLSGIKGDLALGKMADIVVFDPESE